MEWDYPSLLGARGYDVVRCPMCSDPTSSYSLCRLSQFPHHATHFHRSTVDPLRQCVWCFGLHRWKEADLTSREVDRHQRECLEKFRAATLVDPNKVPSDFLLRSEESELCASLSYAAAVATTRKDVVPSAGPSCSPEQEPSFLEKLVAVKSREKNPKARRFNVLALHVGILDSCEVSSREEDAGRLHTRDCDFRRCDCPEYIERPEKYFLRKEETVVEIRGKGWHFEKSCVWVPMIRYNDGEYDFVHRAETYCECTKRFLSRVPFAT